MSLPAIIKRNTAAKLERAIAERDKAQAAVTDLLAKRDGLDVTADDYVTAWQTLGAQIQVHERAIGILSDQIARLEAKVADEEAAAAKARRAAAVTKIEQLLPQWITAARKFETWVKAGGSALSAMVEARKQITAAWPTDDIELPFVFFFDHHRAIRALHAAFNYSLHAPDELAKVMVHITENIDGFADVERKMMVELLESLHTSAHETEKDQAA